LWCFFSVLACQYANAVSMEPMNKCAFKLVQHNVYRSQITQAWPPTAYKRTRARTHTHTCTNASTHTHNNVTHMTLVDASTHIHSHTRARMHACMQGRSLMRMHKHMHT
jgi:hypothetical protein